MVAQSVAEAGWERLEAGGVPPTMRHGLACAALRTRDRALLYVFGGIDAAARLGSGGATASATPACPAPRRPVIPPRG